MHRYQRLFILILVIIALAVWIVLPNNKGIHLLGINRSIQTRYGLDLVGGVQALLEADLPAGTAVSSESMSTARSIVENRVNGLGVTEAIVQQAGDRRIVVELPGETDPEKALATLKQTGLLEFVDFTQLTQQEALTLENNKTTIRTDFGQASSTQSSGTSTPVASATSTVAATGTVTSTVPVTSTQQTNETSQVFHTVMTGASLKTVNVIRDQVGDYQVSFTLDTEGAKTFADFTSKNVGKILAIVLDKKVISAPSINTAITEGSGIIQGSFTSESANNLAVQLRYGSLPIPLKVVTSQTVGPTLGQDSLRKSLTAGIIGLTVVILFMALFYRLPGVIADLALLCFALFAFALFKFIPVTLTLPGIAGFVLSIGVAVDANILIFERMKEEIRAGRTLRQGIDMGWARAWPSIRDSNISTLITCLILFWFGSTFGASIVKGFSLTLALSVLVSMFTAIVVTRTFLHLVLDNLQFAEHPRWFGV